MRYDAIKILVKSKTFARKDKNKDKKLNNKVPSVDNYITNIKGNTFLYHAQNKFHYQSKNCNNFTSFKHVSGNKHEIFLY